MKALLLLLVVALSACGPKCIKGHDTQVWIAESCDPIYIHMPMGDTTIPIYAGEDCTPAHWRMVFVCDQYEVEK